MRAAHEPRLAALVALAAVIAGCAGGGAPDGDGAADGDAAGDADSALARHAGEEEVGEDRVFLYPFAVNESVNVSARFAVVRGGPVDAWLGTSAECGRFGHPDFGPRAAAPDSSGAELEARFEAGDLCLILDNSGIEGRARPRGAVVVNFTIAVWPLESGATA